MFSQRVGITPTEKVAQRESIDDALRNSLWSVLTNFYWEYFNLPIKIQFERGRHDEIRRSNLSGIFVTFWLDYIKHPLDTIPTYYYKSGGGLEYLRRYYFEASWYEVYDFVEMVAHSGPEERKEEYISACNNFLERENSAYRFINDQIAEITSGQEIEAVEEAVLKSEPYRGVKKHLEQALQLLKDRRSPDYRNSIKESISSVEALCRQIEGPNQAKLGAALNALERRNVLHPALKSAFSSLYGYTSDSNGIRHALLEDSNLTNADARFMLVSCSAFINYVIDSIEC